MIGYINTVECRFEAAVLVFVEVQLTRMISSRFKTKMINVDIFVLTDLDVFGECVGFDELIGEDYAAEEVNRGVGLHRRVVVVHDERFHFEFSGKTVAINE